MSLVTKAIAFARHAHRNQKRKYTGEPYINHPIEVMEILLKRVPHVTDDMLAAAVLHDVVEDTDVPLWEIGANFGPQVELLVKELTEVKTEGNRRTRKEAEAQRLSKVSGDAQTIKYADLISNTKDIRENDPGFAKVYLKEKQRLLMLMDDGYQALRQEAWLATLEPKEPHCGFISYAEAQKMVGG